MSAREIIFVLSLWFASPLIAYLAVVVCGAVWLRRTRARALGATRPVLHRTLLAAYLALVFTPSRITDFWLFGFWGPALLGLFFLIPGTLVHVFSLPDTGADVPWHDLTPTVPAHSDLLLFTLKATTIYHLLPILAGFLIFYFFLWALSRFRSASRRQPI